MYRIMNRRLAGLLLTGALALAASPEVRAGAVLEGVVNINTATVQELELLPSVGEVRARAIVEHRKENGPFKNVQDLVQVSGIGTQALQGLAPYCVLTGRTTARRE